VAASAGVGFAAAPLLARAGETSPPHAPRISYYCNGEIHVNEIGKPEGKPLTTGHWDFKPSWSKTGDMLVCFRRLKNDPITEMKLEIDTFHDIGARIRALKLPTFAVLEGGYAREFAQCVDAFIAGWESMTCAGMSSGTRRITGSTPCTSFAPSATSWAIRYTLP